MSMADMTKIKELDIVKYANPETLEEQKPNYGEGLAGLYGIVRDTYKDKCYVEFFNKRNKTLDVVCRPYIELVKVGSMYELISRGANPVGPKIIVKEVKVKEPKVKEPKVKVAKAPKEHKAVVKEVHAPVLGQSNKLSGLRILPTGLFDNFSRSSFIDSIIANGGIYGSGGVNKKLDILVVGRAAGPAKINKANELGIRMISEEDYLAMLK